MFLEYEGKINKDILLKSPRSSYIIGDYCSDNNLLFNGDNLEALKQLLYIGYKNKIDLVYIDPPFATNIDFTISGTKASSVSRSNRGSIAYSDKLIGSEFLEFLRQRLIFIHELLSDTGSIYVHIDYKIGHYVKLIMDEIFGRNNFINDLTRIKCNPKNFSRKAFGNVKDMVLFYSKASTYTWNETSLNYSAKEINTRFNKISSNGRRYTTVPLHAPGETAEGPTGMPWRGLNPPEGRHWRCSPRELDELDRKGLIEWSNTGNPRKIIYADERIDKGKKYQDVLEFKDKQILKYPTEKNIDLLKMFIETSSNKGDTVLDCFCGSGTTLVASELLERKWIGIDNSQIAVAITEKRLMEECFCNMFDKSYSVLKLEQFQKSLDKSS